MRRRAIAAVFVRGAALVVRGRWWCRPVFPLLSAGVIGAPLAAQAQSVRADSASACIQRRDLRGATLLDALQGRIPGVQVVSTGGGGGNIRVRGVRTLGSNDPLIFVDHIRVAELRPPPGRTVFTIPLLEFVDIQNVTRIEVLRGPEATLRYGGEATNGVILIHTTRGTDSDTTAGPRSRARCPGGAE